MAPTNYRNYTINAEDCVVIRLDTNFTTTVIPTNSLRENEYQNYLIGQINDVVPNRDIELSEDKVITIRIGLWLGKFAISIRFFDLEDYNNTHPNYTKDIPDGLIIKIEKTIEQYIDSINDAKITFFTFDKDELIQVYNNKVYGYFFDLSTGQYAKPPQVIKNTLRITGPSVNVKERIEAFIR